MDWLEIINSDISLLLSYLTLHSSYVIHLLFHRTHSFLSHLHTHSPFHTHTHDLLLFGDTRTYTHTQTILFLSCNGKPACASRRKPGRRKNNKRECACCMCVRRVCVCTDNIKSYPKERNKVYVTCLSLFPNFHTTKIISLTSC